MTIVNAETGEVIEPLNDDEVLALIRAEGVIKNGLRTFVEVGDALAEIRDGRLYRQTHGTFEDYCKVKWSLSRPQAYRLIVAADVAHEMSPIGDIQPVNENQARQLTPLRGEPELMAQAMQAAAEATQGAITAVAIAEQVAEIVANKEADVAPVPGTQSAPSLRGPRLPKPRAGQFDKALHSLGGMTIAFESVDPEDLPLDAEKAAAVCDDLTSAIRSLTNLRKRIKEKYL